MEKAREKRGAGHHGPHGGQPGEHRFMMTFRTDPDLPRAGDPAVLSFTVTRGQEGEMIREFTRVHDMLMHVIIVSGDLAYFDHVHPVLAEGIFSIGHTFPAAGTYRVWGDATPAGGSRVLAAFPLQVTGEPSRQVIPLAPSGALTGKFLGGAYRVSLHFSEDPVAGRELGLTFRFEDSTGRPVRDLSPLMGAGGHTVIISGDLGEFLHVHPREEVSRDWTGGPEISFGTRFPKEGLYKIWGQFLHRGRLVTADFTVVVR